MASKILDRRTNPRKASRLGSSAGADRGLVLGIVNISGVQSMTRDETTERILAAKHATGLTFADIAKTVGRHPVWVTAALLGQAVMSAEEAAKATAALGLGKDVAASLQEPPMRGSIGQAVPVDPVIYRLYEMVHVYG